MNKEIFKDIPGYEGFYQVSNIGNVKSLERYAPFKNGKKLIKERIIKHSINSNGYYQLHLYKEGEIKFFLIHMLVAITFLNHIPDGTTKTVIDHINNNPLDNRVSNLQLITHRQNISKSKKGTSKYTGVSWYKPYNKWKASITIYGKLKHLGYFTSEIDAHEAYQKALNQFNNNNEKNEKI